MTHQNVTISRLACLLVGAALFVSGPAVSESSPDSQKPNLLFSQEISGLNENIKKLLNTESPIYEIYEDRSFAPIWVDESGALSARGVDLMSALQSVDKHALPVARYARARMAVAALSPAHRTVDTGAMAQVERDLTAVFGLFARDLASGVLEPRKVDKEIYVTPNRPDTAALLRQASWAGDVGKLLNALAPRSRDYASLRDEYAKMRAATEDTSWGDTVQRGKSLKEGDRSDRVPALRARLVALGDLAPEDAELSPAEPAILAANDVTTDALPQPILPDPLVYDIRLGAAVRRFQERHGLNDDGIVGPATLAAINTSGETRLQQIAVNLERMRWMNRDLGGQHVMVNLAGYTMAFVENGTSRFTSRVVVGKARKHQTPEFSDEMEFMVVNPTWNVPWSIATKEILPKLRENPNYLIENNMVLTGTDVDPASVDWHSVTPATFPGRVKQQPGDNNALGYVKFLFPNDFAIYLHDTPSRSLFAKDRRAFSHGCVRVQKPIEFAHLLLSLQTDDPVGRFQSYRDSGRERWVTLERKIPVHLTYRTAWIDEQNRRQFREDIYGRDRRIFEALRVAGLDLSDTAAAQ